MRLLLIGGSGQLGLSLQKRAFLYPYIEMFAPSKNDLNLLDFDCVKDTIKKLAPNVIINSSGYTDVYNAEINRNIALELNVNTARNIAQIAGNENIPLIHLSTDYVFDGNKKTPYTETDSPSPLNFYGETKLMGENEVLKYNPLSLIIRSSWFFSPYGNNFLKKILFKIDKEKILKIADDIIGTPTFCQDLADCILNISTYLNPYLSIDKYGIYNFSNISQISCYDFVVCILKVFELTHKIELIKVSYNDLNFHVKRPLNSALECTKIVNNWKINLRSWENSLIEVKGLIKK